MPPEVENDLKRFFLKTDRIQEMLSERWREHTNRRTIIILLLAGTFSIVSYLFVISPPDDFPLEKLITVPEGASLSETSRILEDAHVIRSLLAFRVLVALSGNEQSVHAGDYLFKEPLSVFSVARVVSIGAYGLEPLRMRVPEGATTKDMALIFGGRLERFNKERFLSIARPLEGYFFPDTYFFLPNATEDTVISALRQNFDTHIATLDEQIQKFGKPLSDIVTMASILEREAPPGEDRHIIAGILWKRLAIGMPLQVDVTFLYTLGKGTFQLTTKALITDSPYNTYTNKGLPPGPIGSPSLDALEAAVNPTKTKYLYFLADRSGVTHYSKTYEEQIMKKDLYF